MRRSGSNSTTSAEAVDVDIVDQLKQLPKKTSSLPPPVVMKVRGARMMTTGGGGTPFAWHRGLSMMDVSAHSGSWDTPSTVSVASGGNILAPQLQRPNTSQQPKPSGSGRMTVMTTRRNKTKNKPKAKKTKGGREPSKDGPNMAALSARTYTIEKIVNKREVITEDNEREVQYRIKWKGYAGSQNTWESAKTLATDGCKHMADAFEKSLKIKTQKAKEKKKRRKTVPVPASSTSGLSDLFAPITASEMEEEMEMNAQAEVNVDSGVLTKWRRNEVPLEVVGSAQLEGYLCYIVKIRTEGAVAAGVLFPGNCRIIRAVPFKRQFPSLVIGHYQNNIDRGLISERDDDD